MATGDLSKLALSGSTNGRNIKVAATATPGTTIHTAVTGTAAFDEVWLWACNTGTAEVKLTIEFGGTTSPDDLMEVSIPGESGWVPIVDGMVLQNALLVRAFAGTANAINVNGFVNRIE